MSIFKVISIVWAVILLSSTAYSQGSEGFNGDPNMELSQSENDSSEGMYSSCVDTNCGVAATPAALFQSTVANTENIDKQTGQQVK